ncbi:hypothetical protein L596_023914 [Steinernema carpocapsae]|uniref:Uncharacterized protein n=1 Tax=Steinernema carpocapsae TaxID=34508 RepID=A0A4U5MFA8_STECR|nr:hypothetical protein L596_023903 [Steinernema carpocapsae]TKR67823.1 hypothetical protein L596_023914 [Steinernema carpocapsae]
MAAIVDAIGLLINPACRNIDVKTIHQLLGYDYGRGKKKVKHSKTGRLVFRGRRSNRLELPKVETTPTTVVLENLSEISSPLTDRKRKLSCRKEKSVVRDFIIDDVEEKVGEFPSWSAFIPNLEERAPELLLCQNDEISFQLMRELEDLWKEWSVESVRRVAESSVRQP